MAEKQTHQEQQLIRDPSILDYWTRLVLERTTTDKPLSDWDTRVIGRAVTDQATDFGDLFNLRAYWDEPTDKLHLECNIEAQDESEATRIAVRHIYRGLRDRSELYGKFNIFNMYLGSVARLESIEAEGGKDIQRAIGSEEFDVSGIAHDEAREVALFDRMFKQS